MDELRTGELQTDGDNVIETDAEQAKQAEQSPLVSIPDDDHDQHEPDLDRICAVYDAIGNVQRYDVFSYLYRLKPGEDIANPTEIFEGTDVQSYYIVQRCLRILEGAGLVEIRGKVKQNVYYGLTEKGRRIADVLVKVEEII